MVIGALIVGWQVYEAREETRIRPGATVSGVEIGGLEPEEAVIALEPVVKEVAETTIDLQFPDIDLQSPRHRPAVPGPHDHGHRRGTRNLAGFRADSRRGRQPARRRWSGRPRGCSICSPAAT